MEIPSEGTMYTDRSRYEDGFTCEWRRLLRFHAFQTGIETNRISPALAVGLSVHSTLEGMLLHRLKYPNDPIDKLVVEALLMEQSRLGRFVPFMQLHEQTQATEMVKNAVDICVAIPHAYARIVLPWLDKQFKVLTIEQEYVFKPQYRVAGPPNGEGLMAPRYDLHFNSRPDFVAEDKATGRISVHDFKTASSFQQDRELLTYADNVQLMINSMQVMRDLNLDYYPPYYVHILIKGNDYSPSPLIHAYWQPEVPALQQERWEPKFWLPPVKEGGKRRSIGRSFQKVRVSDHKSVADWVWEMPASVAAEQSVVLGPFPVNPLKVSQFIAGLGRNEEHWLQRTADLDWRQWGEPGFMRHLDATFPRTFRCYTYESRCQFYSLCFRDTGWVNPVEHGFKPREPHHTTEPQKEFIR